SIEKHGDKKIKLGLLNVGLSHILLFIVGPNLTQRSLANAIIV
ncbi:unnamed protein product, partial [Brassica rapa]